MLLATTTVEDFDRFNSVFGTKGAEKRKQHTFGKQLSDQLSA